MECPSAGNAYQYGSVEQIVDVPTIGPADTFMPMGSGNPSFNLTAIRPVNREIRNRIAQVAESKLGSQNWLDQPNLNQCNIFVHDVLKEAGSLEPHSDLSSERRRLAFYFGLVDSPYYPAQAGDWANRGKTLACWKTVTVRPPYAWPADLSGPGDVIAETITYEDATGHVGIIVSPQHTFSADSAVDCYNPPTPRGTITDSDYGFRPDNYVDPAGCRHFGLKKQAVVKRFSCW